MFVLIYLCGTKNELENAWNIACGALPRGALPRFKADLLFGLSFVVTSVKSSATQENMDFLGEIKPLIILGDLDSSSKRFKCLCAD